ncbi:hypothetical protein [Thermosynechococcus sp.]|uniref:hypothetical protein n=1 Tax=Thermosynechococcus sp. TaxID=2814275 RepID=UPI00260D3C7D|nr:hypothetical protein [Thermosynechococcus sp.]
MVMSILTVEVLLLATAADDRGKRFDRYRRNPDLVECAGYLRGNGTRHHIHLSKKQRNESKLAIASNREALSQGAH